MNNNYPTCPETYSTLRIYSEKKSPNEITNYLEINPSDFSVKGELSEHKSIGTNKINSWFFSTENIIESNDSRDHIDFLCQTLLPIKNKIKKLKEDNAEIDISCFWMSQNGHGGPTLSTIQLKELAQLEIDIWYNFY